MLRIEDKNKLNLLFVFLEFVLILFLGKVLMSSLLTEQSRLVEDVVLSVFLFLFFPLVVNWTILKTDLRKMLVFPKEKETWMLIFGGVFFLVSLLLLLVFVPSLVVYVPFSSWIIGSLPFFVLVEFFLLPLIVFSQEFFFRGVLQENVEKVFSEKWAIFFQAVFFLIFFLVFSTSENVFGTGVIVFLINLFLGSLFWWGKKNIFVPFFIHWLTMIGLDLLMFFQVRG